MKPPRDLRPSLGAARVGVQLCLVVIIAELLIDVWDGYAVQAALDEVPPGLAAPMDALPLSQTTVEALNLAARWSAMAGLVAVLAMIVAAILVLRWQAIAVGNQWHLGLDEPRFSPATAGWCWFIPVWSLGAPCLVYRDLWRSGELDDQPRSSRPEWLSRRVPPLVHGWWACWLVGSLATQVVLRLTGTSLQGSRIDAVAMLVSDVAWIAAGLMFLRILGDVTARQHVRAEQVSAMPAAVAANSDSSATYRVVARGASTDESQGRAVTRGADRSGG